MRFLLVIVLLLVVATPAHAAAVFHLEAVIDRSEFMRGDTVMIDCFLFNDGDTAAPGLILVTAPAGFVPLGVIGARGDIEPGRALRLDARYLVADDAEKGLHTFVVRGGGQVRRMTIRVGPVVAPPAWRSLYLPVIGG